MRPLAEPGARLVVEADGAVVEPRRRAAWSRIAGGDAGRRHLAAEDHARPEALVERQRDGVAAATAGWAEDAGHRLTARRGGRVACARRAGGGSPRAPRSRAAPAPAGRRQPRARRRRRGRRSRRARPGCAILLAAQPHAPRARRPAHGATRDPRTDQKRCPCARGPDSIRCSGGTDWLGVGRAGDGHDPSGILSAMPLTPAERETMAGRLGGLEHDVRLALYTRADGCDTCADTRAIVEEVAALSPHLSFESARPGAPDARRALGIDHAPAIVVLRRVDGALRRCRGAPGRRAARARADVAGRRDPDRRRAATPASAPTACAAWRR